jgi:hypothetical protein
MNLQQMCNAAGRIFRGTVLGATEGTVTAGGGQLTTIVYRIRVSVPQFFSDRANDFSVRMESSGRVTQSYSG